MDNHGRSFPTIENIQVIQSRGPWRTKSGGELNVLFGASLSTVNHRFLRYDDAETRRLPSDIRGLRVYMVRDIPVGSVGGKEWHRIREKIVFALEGAVHWACEDLFGNRKEFIIDSNEGVWMPPFILHTYESMREKSGLLVVANTLFVPDEPRTHDTYSEEAFRKLQKKHAI